MSQNNRYCCLNWCQNFLGTTDPDVKFFRTPSNPELRIKWAECLNLSPSVGYRLCSQHFRKEHLRTNGRLKPGAIPIPVSRTVKTEISEAAPTECIEVVHIEEVESAPDQKELCHTCIQYEGQLKAAREQIVLLKHKLIELTTENKMLKNQILLESTEELICNEASHEELIQQAKQIWKKTEPDEMISVNELILNDGPMSPALLNVEMDESTYDKLLVEALNESSEEMEETIETTIQQSKLVDESIQPPQEISKMYYQCGSCNISFDSPRKLSHHISQVHRTTQALSLPRSKSQFPKAKNTPVLSLPETTKIARKRKRVERIFQCYLCGMNCSTKQILRAHMYLHERCHKCDICKTALTQNELNSHLCGEEKTIRCDYCPIEFTVTLELLEHLEKSHEKRKFYRCEKCPKFIASIALKETHMKSHELDAPKRFICEVCSKAFTSRVNLRSHRRSHVKTKSHLCEECGRGFRDARNLLIHKGSHIHSEVPTFHCPHCTKKFFQRDSFERHIESAHREDKYVCEICQNELSSKNSFEQHLRNHRRTDTDRKYDCKLCHLKFFKRATLNAHQKVHTSARLFSCRFCKLSYKYKGDLNKHLKTHIGNKIHECKKCFELFEYKDLLKHENEHYKQEKEANETNK
ncbi:zinc finger and SCAN domain-containing protein 12-like [Sitodiplosis mosellana]|uniref:zinc finger and SCAN domain-containing protein 12-like n=1 Tax=Sitodiplosis mosellana TaxID=263140 RepID=UPI0024447128|nr:zinc finger and SCAN domain-containing protein 12-like [Sitodiplosis mosellana]